MKKMGKCLKKCVPFVMLIAAICGVFIMWVDFKLTNRPFLEIQPIAFTVDPDGRGDSESEIWSTLYFKFINHGKTPAYEIKVEKLKASLRREIDLVNDIESKVKNLCVFPRSSVGKHTSFTADKDYALKVIKGTESISLDIKITYRGPNKFLGLDKYWYVFEGKIIGKQVKITNTDGN